MALHFIQDITGRLMLGLGGRFRIGRLGSLRFSDTVQPVVSVEPIISKHEAAKDTKDISAAAGSFVEYFAVPEGEEWDVVGGVRPVTTASSQIILRREAVNYEMSSFGTSPAYSLDSPFTARHGDAIGMLTTGNGGDAARQLSISYYVTKTR